MTNELYERHRRELSASGVGDREIAAKGYYSVPSYNEAKKAVAPNPLTKFSGPALIIPLHGTDGEPSGKHQVKPDNPPPDPKSPGKVRKYLNPRDQKATVDCAPTMIDAILSESEPLIVTEGSKKIQAAATRGIAAIALLGVSSWSSGGLALPEFKEIPLAGRSVYVCFDHDCMTKHEVRTQANRLADYLRMKKAKVRFILLPMVGEDEKTGLDDWLVANPEADPFDLAADEIPPDHRKIPRAYARTHQGCAERLSDEYGDVIGHCSFTGWRVWNGHVWDASEDSEGIVRTYVMSLRDTIYREVEMMTTAGVSAEEIGRHKRLAHEVQATGYQEAVLKQLRNLVGKRWDTFDTNPDLFTVGNGTLEFHDDGTVTLREHDPADRITLGTTVPYYADAESPFFIDTMNKALPDDIRGFVQRAAGYSMIGGNGEQVIMINHGSGGNLKSTFLTGVGYALGDMCIDVDPDTLRKGVRQGSAPAPDKMRLLGPRFVCSTETSGSGVALDTEFLKRISGGESIVARPLHGKTVSFHPAFTLWMSTNMAPDIEDDTHGMWRRVRMIPWRYTMTDEERISWGTVQQKLKAEASGILAWLVRGYADYRIRRGLDEPESVKAYTAAVRHDLDWFSAYADDRLVEDEESAILRSELWKDFESWRWGNTDLRKIRQGEVFARAESRFGDQAKKVTVNGKRALGWTGVRLTHDF